MLHPETSSVLRYIPDTIQTPPDTTQTPPAKGVLCNIGHWKKRPYLIFITFYNILRDLAFIHLRHPETPSRHHPDTPRHNPDDPIYRSFIQYRALEEIASISEFHDLL